MSRAKTIAKAAKLKALALDQAGTPEGDLAMQHAERVLAEHGLGVGDIDHNEQAQGGTRLCGTTGWESYLAVAVGMVTGTFPLGHPGRVTKVYGTAIDREIAAHLFASLKSQLANDVNAWRTKLRKLPDGREVRTWRSRGEIGDWRRSWAAGTIVKAQLLQKFAKQQPQGQSGGSAIMVIADKVAEAERSLRSTGMRIGSSRPGSSSGHKGAMEQGKNASFSKGVTAKLTLRLT